MTEQEKKLLLQDLCARLPYGVNFKQSDSSTIKMRSVGFETKNVIPINLFFKKPDFYLFDNYGNLVLKPYLRPMSSMTEEEKDVFQCFIYPACNDPVSMIDWLNSHHFDYRGLIEMGLAYEAPEGMYDTKI